jgi:hypothetical protein
LATDCHEVQVNLCNSLKNKANDGGGDPVNNSYTSKTGLSMNDVSDALNNCDSAGLSKAMYDYLSSNPCSSPNHLASYANASGGDMGKLEEYATGPCRTMATSFNSTLQAKNKELEDAVNQFWQIQGSGVPGGSSSSTRNMSP